MFWIGCLTGFLALTVVLSAAVIVAVNIPRAQTAVILVNWYESAKGPTYTTTVPFTDIDDLPPAQWVAVSKLYNLGLTAGTSPTTYGPHERTKLYQWFIFIGKLLMKLQ